MSKAKFVVTARMDSAGGLQKGTVEIDRESGLVTIRPMGKHRTYTAPLSTVADIICQRIILNEMADSKRAKKASR